MTSKENDSPNEEEALQTPFTAGKTVKIRAGGRTWEGSPEELQALRDRLNEVEFRD